MYGRKKKTFSVLWLKDSSSRHLENAFLHSDPDCWYAEFKDSAQVLLNYCRAVWKCVHFWLPLFIWSMYYVASASVDEGCPVFLASFEENTDGAKSYKITSCLFFCCLLLFIRNCSMEEVSWVNTGKLL